MPGCLQRLVMRRALYVMLIISWDEPRTSVGTLRVAACSGVQMGPGATILHRIPLGASCAERARVKDTIAPSRHEKARQI